MTSKPARKLVYDPEAIERMCFGPLIKKRVRAFYVRAKELGLETILIQHKLNRYLRETGQINVSVIGNPIVILENPEQKTMLGEHFNMISLEIDCCPLTLSLFLSGSSNQKKIYAVTIL